MNMHDNVKEGINDLDLFYIQRIYIYICQEVKFRWDLSIQLSLIDYRWAWITYYYFINNKIINNRINIIVLIKDDHLIFTTLRCFMQTFQNNILKKRT